MNEDIEMILHSKKLRYEYLEDIIKPYIPQDIKKFDTVNIFIDLYDMIKQLYKPSIVERLNHIGNAPERYEISSELINMISHYRHYFYSRRYKYTNIYFFYSDKKSKYHINLFSDYRKDFYNKRLLTGKNVDYKIVTSIIHENIKILKTFINYVPNAYLINTGTIEYSLLPYIMMNNDIPKFDKSLPTFIISNDIIYYQDLVLFSNLYQLTCKSKNSSIITSDNFINDLTKNLKSVPDINFINDLYPILLSIIGYDKYEVPKINGMAIGRGIKWFNKNLIDSGVLSNIRYTSVKTLKDMLFKSNLDKDIIDKMILNFRLLSHDAMNNVAFNEVNIKKISNDISLDLVDAKSVKYVNDKYFRNYPIILEHCFEGETY